MCRNIKTLYNFEPPATGEEIRAAALQFVRKISGFAVPSTANQKAFNRAVDEITQATSTLLAGGHIALQIAVRHPDLLPKLVIESAMFQRDGSDAEFWESFEHAKLGDMPAELREAYLKVASHPEDLPIFFAKSVKRMLDFKGWTPIEIKSIDAPTLVIIGDHDIIHPEHAVLMFRLLPNAQLAVLPGTDHMTIVNRSDWLLSMVEAFLGSPMPKETSP